jgi:hypothetical protein
MPQGVVDSADRVIEGLLALTFHSIASQHLATLFQGVSAPVARALQGGPGDAGGAGMEERTRQLPVKSLIPLVYSPSCGGLYQMLFIT